MLDEPPLRSVCDGPVQCSDAKHRCTLPFCDNGRCAQPRRMARNRDERRTCRPETTIFPRDFEGSPMRRYMFATAMLFLCGAEPTALAAAPPARASSVEVQILAINDFHGNLDSPPSPPIIVLTDGSKFEQRVGAASALSATIKRLRSGHRRTITVSA